MNIQDIKIGNIYYLENGEEVEVKFILENEKRVIAEIQEEVTYFTYDGDEQVDTRGSELHKILTPEELFEDKKTVIDNYFKLKSEKIKNIEENIKQQADKHRELLVENRDLNRTISKSQYLLRDVQREISNNEKQLEEDKKEHTKKYSGLYEFLDTYEKLFEKQDFGNMLKYNKFYYDYGGEYCDYVVKDNVHISFCLNDDNKRKPMLIITGGHSKLNKTKYTVNEFLREFNVDEDVIYKRIIKRLDGKVKQWHDFTKDAPELVAQQLKIQNQYTKGTVKIGYNAKSWLEQEKQKQIEVLKEKIEMLEKTQGE